MRVFINLCITITLIYISFPLQAQKSARAHSFEQAQELISQKKYAAAQSLFQSFLDQAHGDRPNQEMEAHYWMAICDAKLYHSNAAHSLESFIARYPVSSFAPDALLELGNVYYRDKLYRQAHQTMGKVAPLEFKDRNLVEYHFRNAYSLFMDGKADSAKLFFHEIMDSQTNFAPLATYYYAYILYQEGNFQTALENFSKLSDDPSFGPHVPFFIMQIYYHQGQFDSITQNGDSVKAKASPKRAVEMSRIIGEAYYYNLHYATALPYLQEFFTRIDRKPTQNEHYIMGYTHYNLKHYDTAIVHFQSAILPNDSSLISQNALYHLGHCYIQLDKPQYKFALNAFNDAAKINLDPRIREHAFYNYIKLSFELSIGSLQETISSFESFLQNFPNSRYVEEIYGYLVQMFSGTKNYNDALNSLSKIKRKTPQLLEIQQRMAYNRAVELFAQQNFEHAITWFDTTLVMGIDESLTLKAILWRGEAHFRLGRYAVALDDFERFLLHTATPQYEEYPLACYNAAYAAMKLERYDLAKRYFLQVIARKNQVKSSLLTDTYLRTGDSYFALKQYDNAIGYYDQALAMKLKDQDLAMLQKALCLGVLGRFDEKIAVLQKLIQDLPESRYTAQAINELAASFLVIDQRSKALNYYTLLADKFPNTAYSRTAMLKIGLIQLSSGQNQEALKTLQVVVEKHSGTPEAREALATMKNIYVQLNKVDDFFAYIKKIQGFQIKESEQDSLSFSAAESRYLNQDFSSAYESFKTYLSRFPNGYFTAEANFYGAESALRSGKNAEALALYEATLKLPESFFTERALGHAARISSDLGQYKKAYKHYEHWARYSEHEANVINAQLGMLRNAVKAQLDRESTAAAQNIIQSKLFSPEQRDEATYVLASYYKKTGSTDSATLYFQALRTSKNTNYSAEAQYFELEQLFLKGNLDQTEKAIFQFVENASNEYYLAKSYLLWGRIFFTRGNLPQAQQTYQSVIDNYDKRDDGLIAEAEKLLNQVIAEIELIEAMREAQYTAEPLQDDELPLPAEI